jgi:hypothetical protein
MLDIYYIYKLNFNLCGIIAKFCWLFGKCRWISSCGANGQDCTLLASGWGPLWNKEHLAQSIFQFLTCLSIKRVLHHTFTKTYDYLIYLSNFLLAVKAISSKSYIQWLSTLSSPCKANISTPSPFTWAHVR